MPALRTIAIPHDLSRCTVQRCGKRTDYLLDYDLITNIGVATFRRALCAKHTWKRAHEVVRFQAAQIREAQRDPHMRWLTAETHASC